MWHPSYASTCAWMAPVDRQAAVDQEVAGTLGPPRLALVPLYLYAMKVLETKAVTPGVPGQPAALGGGEGSWGWHTREGERSRVGCCAGCGKGVDGGLLGWGANTRDVCVHANQQPRGAGLQSWSGTLPAGLAVRTPRVLGGGGKGSQQPACTA